ncbi:MAG: PD-(D/E)XK nuclease family protein [Gammaproteobacteria bacterium]
MGFEVNFFNEENSMKTTPNIFNFATSELSQDAALAYMLAWADAGNKGKGGGMHALGQDFVKRLFGKHDAKRAPSSIKSVEVETQRHIGERRNVDVVATINGEYVLLIEDKTDSIEHSGQLEAYLDALQKEHGAEKVFPVYLKTGYVFNDEREIVAGKGYGVFDLNDLLEFFAEYKNIDDDVFAQFHDHCVQTAKNRDDTVAEVLGGQMPPTERPESGYPAWDWEYTQWEFMLKLKEKLESAGNNEWMNLRARLPEAHHFPANFTEWAAGGGEGTWVDEVNRTFIKRGTNVGGSPWTQYWFTKLLFWRIDTDFPLRLRFGVWEDEVHEYDPWREYRNCFAQCFTEDIPLKQSGEARVVATSNERNIGGIDSVDVDALLDHIAKIHNQFVKGTESIGWKQ